VLKLLTAKEVAAQLQLKSERTVARLGIPSGVRQLHADSAGIAARIIVAIS
jgi:hypothetical protein